MADIFVQQEKKTLAVHPTGWILEFQIVWKIKPRSVRSCAHSAD
jgi:hypothetical protein